MRKNKLIAFSSTALLISSTSLACPVPVKAPAQATRFDWSSTVKENRQPSATPSFGGPSVALWSAESTFANAGEKYLNDLKADPEVRDVWVSIPVKIEGSGYAPFGDGQSNSRIHFPDWKIPETPPYMAALILFQNPKRNPEVEVRFHPNVNTKIFMVSILNAFSQKPEEASITKATVTVKDNVPTIRFDLGKLPAKSKMEVFSGVKGLWVSGSGWKDGFPLVFKTNAWRSILKKNELIFPSIEEEFKGCQFFKGGNNIDPEQIAKAASELREKRAMFAFAKASWRFHKDVGVIGFVTSGKDMGKFAGFPPKPVAGGAPMSVHGEFKNSYNDPALAYTAVGGVATSLALKGEKGSNVKHLYTCFTARTPEYEVVKQPSPQWPPGVPSGAGWHKVGDPAETVFNSLESAAILTAITVENPFGTARKPENFSYNLNSSATLRWTAPGEAFVTAQGEHHWYAVHDQTWPVCTEILVHDEVPGLQNHLGMKCP